MAEKDPEDRQDEGPADDRQDGDDLMAPPDDSGQGYEDADYESERAEGETPTSDEPPYLEEPGQGHGPSATGSPATGMNEANTTSGGAGRGPRWLSSSSAWPGH